MQDDLKNTSNNLDQLTFDPDLEAMQRAILAGCNVCLL